MPYVNIQIVGSATREQKERLVAEVTESLVTILNKDRDRTTVVIQEVSPENWGIGGLLRDDWVRRKDANRDG